MIEALQHLDLYSWASHFLVVLLRTMGLFIFLPFFSARILPVRVRFSLALVMAFVFVPFAPRLEMPPPDMVAWVVVGVRELAAGFGLGIAARVIFAGVETAAQLVAGQSGFALASMVDPASGELSPAPSLFLNLLSLALFLAADLHHMFIRAIHGSYRLLPPAIELPDVSAFADFAGLLGARLFTVAIELAAPALIVTVAIDLVLVLVGKAMPQVPILIVGYPFKMAAGLVALALLSVGTGAAIGWIGRTIASDGAALVSALAGS